MQTPHHQARQDTATSCFAGLLAAGAALLSACAGTSRPPGAETTTVYLLRHAEPNSQHPDRPLTERDRAPHSGQGLADPFRGLAQSARGPTQVAGEKSLLIFLLVCIIVGVSPAGAVTIDAKAGHTTVEGKNDPAIDVQAVQRALDRGGTVLLKGRFDFGDTGSVKIANDVRVRGELDERGEPRTAIRGGYLTFESSPPHSAPMPVGPKIEITNIHFEAALWTPLRLAHASRLQIARNRISGVRPHPSPERPQTGLQQGILIGTTFPGDRTSQYRPGSVVGQVVITGNQIDLTTEAPTTTMAQGIFLAWTTGITARIAGNTIVNAARNGIEVVDNYADQDGDGIVLIQDNKVVTGPEGFARPTPRTPNGIAIGYLPRKRGDAERHGVIEHAILRNAVVTLGRTSVGVNVLTDAALVRNNHVLSQGPMARAISVSGSNSHIGRNTIEGVGENGIWLGRRAVGNELDENDFARFKAAVSDVMLAEGASDNVVGGSTGSVSDPGAGNQVRGLTRPVR